MQNKHPDTELYVTINNTSQLKKLLLENQLDIGLAEGMIVDPDLVCRKLCEDELIIVAAPGHPLLHQQTLSIQDLNGQSFISREAGSNDRNQFEQFLLKHGIQIKRAWICSNTQAIKNAVVHGHGLAILSRMLVEEELLQSAHACGISLNEPSQF